MSRELLLTPSRLQNQPRNSRGRNHAIRHHSGSRGRRGFRVWCPALKGCYSQGETQEQEEALENIQEAMASYLGSLQDDPLHIPEDVTNLHIEAAA